MNGSSLLFAALVVLAVAMVAAAVLLVLSGGLRVPAEPPWRKRKAHKHFISTHHG